MITWKHFGQAQIRRRGARRCFYKPRPSHRKKGGTVNCVPVLNTMHSSNFDRCWWCGRTTRQTTRSKTLSAQLILSDPPKTGRDLILGKSLRRRRRKGDRWVNRGGAAAGETNCDPIVMLFRHSLSSLLPLKMGNKQYLRVAEHGAQNDVVPSMEGSVTNEPPCSFEISLNHSVLLRRAYSLSRAI